MIYNLLLRTYEDYKFLEKFCAENRLVTNSISDFKAKNQKSSAIKQILFNARVLKVTQTRCEIGQIASFGLKPAQDGENFKQGFIS